MKNIFCLLYLLVTCSYAIAQDTDEYKKVSEKSWEYHYSRLVTSEPPYNLEKIKGLIKKVSHVEKDDGYTEELVNNIYFGLSLREKFTYHMVHPESYSQNCDGFPAVPDEEKKIFGELPEVYGEYGWSDRQLKFFTANRDSVLAYIKFYVTKEKHIALNYKQVIADVNGKELIPLLVSTYNIEKKDHDILTVLMLLMRDNEYPPFMVSLSFKKLYADKESSYQSFLNFNSANEELIIKRATDFYNGLHK